MSRLSAALCLGVVLFVSVASTGAMGLSLPPNPYIVYFDSGRATLTPPALAVIDNMALHWKAWGFLHLSIVGHCDGAEEAAGSALRLSEQRARVVENALVAVGIPKDRIEAAGRGAAQPAVPREAGIAEMKNRRVEIWYKD